MCCHKLLFPAILGTIISISLVSTASAQTANWTYGLSYINNYSSCSPTVSNNHSLSYADEQINQLDTQLRQAGMTKSFKYANTSVQSTDIIEDYYGGYDYSYGDNVDFYAITTHGGVNNSSNPSIYSAVYCSASSSANYTSAIAKSNYMIFSEQSNNFNNQYNSQTGDLRWLIFSTCHSMDAPIEFWGNRFQFGMDMIMGYKGTMSLGETTDECLADFAHNAFGNESKFKNVWFSGNDDWWLDNTAGIITCGTPENPSSTYSQDRLNNYRKTWPERRVNSSGSYSCSWAYHEG